MKKSADIDPHWVLCWVAIGAVQEFYFFFEDRLVGRGTRSLCEKYAYDADGARTSFGERRCRPVDIGPHPLRRINGQ